MQTEPFSYTRLTALESDTPMPTSAIYHALDVITHVRAIAVQRTAEDLTCLLRLALKVIVAAASGRSCLCLGKLTLLTFRSEINEPSSFHRLVCGSGGFADSKTFSIAAWVLVHSSTRKDMQ